MLFLWLVLLQVALFAVLALFLRFLMARNVRQATSHLHELNQDYTQKLDEARKKREEADKYYDEMTLKAKLDAEKAKVQILKEAQGSQEFILKQSRSQSEDILKQAQNAKDAMLKEVDEEVEKRALLRASELLEKLIPQGIREKVHIAWVEEFSKHGLGGLEKLHLPENLMKAEIITAYPLEASHKSVIEKRIKEKIGRVVSFEEKVDPKLLAGFKVVLGSIVIEGSLNSRVKEEIRHAGFPN